LLFYSKVAVILRYMVKYRAIVNMRILIKYGEGSGPAIILLIRYTIKIRAGK